MYLSTLTEPSPAGLRRARRLCSPHGLVSSSVPLPPAEGEPRFSIYTSLLDDPAQVLTVQQDWDHSSSQGNFDGAGWAIDPQRARDISIVESLERYSSCTWDDSSLVVATEDELGGSAVSPNVLRGPAPVGVRQRRPAARRMGGPLDRHGVRPPHGAAGHPHLPVGR